MIGGPRKSYSDVITPASRGLRETAHAGLSGPLPRRFDLNNLLLAIERLRA
jgi:hypothetical protein